MTTNNFQIKNEEIVEGGGVVRSLVIDATTNHPRPVWRSDRSNGKSPNAGTYQRAKDDDIVIIVTTNPDNNTPVTLKFNIVNDDATTSVEPGFNFHSVINNITPLVHEWLYDSKSQPFLPKGIGWDGEVPEIEKIKMEKALSVLPKGIPAGHQQDISSAISFTSISVFNDVNITQQQAHNDTVDIPDGCSCVIQADKDNNYLSIRLFEEDQVGKHHYEVVSEKTHRLYIIWYTCLMNNASKKVALEIIELI